MNTETNLTPKKPVTITTIKDMKQKGEPITMITAYDVAMARNVNEAGIDMILVGDSLGNVILGYPLQSLLPWTIWCITPKQSCAVIVRPSL